MVTKSVLPTLLLQLSATAREGDFDCHVSYGVAVVAHGGIEVALILPRQSAYTRLNIHSLTYE